MSFSYALPPRLVGRNEHEIGRIVDAEVRSVLQDMTTWPERMTNPNWSAEIDADLMPPLEDAGSGNGAGEDAAIKRERANEKRRAKYAKSKED